MIVPKRSAETKYQVKNTSNDVYSNVLKYEIIIVEKNWG